MCPKKKERGWVFLAGLDQAEECFIEWMVKRMGGGWKRANLGGGAGKFMNVYIFRFFVLKMGISV